MPRRPLGSLLLVSLAIWTSIASTGCTAIGFGAGALIDMGSGKGPPSRLWPMRSGVEVTMWLRDGSKLNGVYRGNQGSSREAAAPVHLASADSLAAPVGVVILLETGQGVQEIPAREVSRVSVPVASGKVACTLVGFGFDVLMVAVAALAASGGGYR